MESVHATRRAGWRLVCRLAGAGAGDTRFHRALNANHMSRSTTTKAQMGKPISLERSDGGIALLKLGRAEARNALTLAMVRDLRPAVAELAANRGCRVIVRVGGAPCRGRGCPYVLVQVVGVVRK